MAGNGERLKGSQLGYRGKGPPDLDTILALQDTYAAAVLAGGLPPRSSPKTIACNSFSPSHRTKTKSKGVCRSCGALERAYAAPAFQSGRCGLG
jgi:hypothetical protein